MKYLLVTLTLFINSCDNENNALIRDKTASEGSITDGIYSSKQFGWSMKVPRSWEVDTSSSKMDEIRQEGRKMINDVDPNVPQGNKPVQLLFAKKNMSSFIAIAEKLGNNETIDLTLQAYAQKKLLTDAYESQGIPVVESKVEAGLLDGVECEILTLAMGDRENLLGQLFYILQRRGYVLTFCITFDNKADRDEIYESLNDCKFESD